MVSNAPRVRASGSRPGGRRPFAMAASRDVVSGASARARSVPRSARARVPRAPVSRARVSRRGRRADRGCVPRFARPPAQGAHRGDAPPRQVRPSGRVRAALARHPRPVPWCAPRDSPTPRSRPTRARVRGDADDVEDATCAALARHRLAEAGYPRARDLESLPRATAEAARSSSRSRGRCIARTSSLARTPTRTRPTSHPPRPALPGPPSRPTRPTAPPHPPPRAPPPRAPSRKSARTSTTRARPRRVPRRTRRRRRRRHVARPHPPLGSADAANPPPPRAPPRGSARRRRATPAFARRRQSSRKDCGRRSRTSRRSRTRAPPGRGAFGYGSARPVREFRRSLLGARATAASFVRVRGVAEPRRGRARCARGGDGGDDGGDPRGVQTPSRRRRVLSNPRSPLETIELDANTMTTTKTNRHSQVM